MLTNSLWTLPKNGIPNDLLSVETDDDRESSKPDFGPLKMRKTLFIMKKQK